MSHSRDYVYCNVCVLTCTVHVYNVQTLYCSGLIGAGLYAEFSLNRNVKRVIEQAAEVDDTVENITTLVN